MKILGISAYYHDAAACLIVDGEIVAAAQEERFSRKRHDADFPTNAINYCLAEGGIQAHQVDYVVFYEKPFLKFERLLETYLAFAPQGFKSFSTSLPIWLKDKLFQKGAILDALHENVGKQIDWHDRLLFSEHHLSHAASAFYPSPFEEAAVLVMDGVGEWATTSCFVGQGHALSLHKEIQFPHSLGLLYSAFTYYAGFKVNSGEYKLMGLAPYGVPKYANLIREHLVDLKEDGSFRLNMRYFNYCTGLTMTNEEFNKLFGGSPRIPESQITQREMDIAASIQAITEEIVIKLARNLRKDTGLANLCLAGGVALNCVANGKLLKEKLFDQIWIQPAAGDAGGAVGAALAANYLMLRQPRSVGITDSMRSGLLGPSFTQTDIESRLHKIGAIFERVSDDRLISLTAAALAEGRAVGWHQGRMEFGPRALGCRSILADPRSPDAQRQLNLKVKFRESFRPFAPSVIKEDAQEWFDLNVDSPYMLLVANIKPEKQLPMSEWQKKLFGIEKLNVPRSVIPAVTHVDYSARVQTVSKEGNVRFYSLLSKFKEITGCPVLVNTSFNIRGEPIVCTPEDAFYCFMGTGIEFLAIGNCILKKEDQDDSLSLEYKNKYELD